MKQVILNLWQENSTLSKINKKKLWFDFYTEVIKSNICDYNDAYAKKIYLCCQLHAKKIMGHLVEKTFCSCLFIYLFFDSREKGQSSSVCQKTSWTEKKLNIKKSNHTLLLTIHQCIHKTHKSWHKKSAN